ncbi:PH domain-containing protein [Blastococcus sp. CT_GayMR16]|uniref:PH domain-containing protein n=1 Tax=Blastococcus sp. CT_GayMR16 TaxID=2559607 RepID=UPI001072FA5F|nr:PH domain-containing protein [Blastococcus sp. CT_GayMR16]TFV87236.1 DUF2510 domain-containing protein [Blastococcus sp. CT_GayMR16]
MAEASWLADPTGAHELRYWNGSSWTEHVSDQGTTGQDPLTTELPPPGAAFQPPPAPPPGATAAPAPAAGGKVSWKDRLKQVADQGKAIADQGKQKLAEQNAKRTEQWAHDPNTLWFGESKNAATSAAGVSKARYRITKDRVWIESGLLGIRTESVPLWSIKDMDVRQAVWQRGNDVGDVVLNLEDPTYGATQDMFNVSGTIEGTTSGQVVLDNIEGPYAVLDILSPLISEARTKKTIERQSSYVHNMTPGAPYGAPMAPPVPAAPPPPAGPQPDLADQLRKLADLRDAGILTDEEFAAQKAKLLGG